MKGLKFRVWASNDNHPDGNMFYAGDKAFAITLFGDLIHNPSGDMTKGFAWARIAFNGVQVMQYTGLKDENDKEIYEGDIVRVETHSYSTLDGSTGKSPFTGVVEFSTASFVVKTGSYRTAFVDMYQGSAEVVGNIHENPELLK